MKHKLRKKFYKWIWKKFYLYTITDLEKKYRQSQVNSFKCCELENLLMYFKSDF